MENRLESTLAPALVGGVRLLLRATAPCQFTFVTPTGWASKVEPDWEGGGHWKRRPATEDLKQKFPHPPVF